MTTHITMTGTYTTRDGREVRVLATDLKGPWPVAAAVTQLDGTEIVFRYRPDGCYADYAHPLDLIPKKKRITGWVNVYAARVCETKEEATRSRLPNIPSGCIHIDIEEGKGL